MFVLLWVCFFFHSENFMTSIFQIETFHDILHIKFFSSRKYSGIANNVRWFLINETFLVAIRVIKKKKNTKSDALWHQTTNPNSHTLTHSHIQTIRIAFHQLYGENRCEYTHKLYCLFDFLPMFYLLCFEHKSMW